MKLTTIKIKPQLLEMWKIVNEFPNYAISTLGRIKSLNYKKQGYAKILRQQKNHVNSCKGYVWYYLEDYEANGDYKPHLTPQQICANTKNKNI